MRSAIFELESILLHYTRAPGSYQNDQRGEKLTHTFVIEVACHFWCVCFPWGRMSSRVNYYATSLIPSGHPWWANDMNNVPCLVVEQIIYSKQLSDSGYQTMLRPEQMSVNLIQKICYLTKPGDLVLDMCCVTIATGRACLFLQQNRRLVECDRDQNFLAKAMPLLPETFDRQVMNKDSALTASEDVLCAGKILVDALDRSFDRIFAKK